jgi:hypothetical protein
LQTMFELDGPRGRDAPFIVEDEEDHQPTNVTIPSKVWTYFVQDVAGNGQTWHYPKETGKLPSAYLLVMPIHKSYQTKMAITKLLQQGQGNQTYKTRAVCLCQPASVTYTRPGRANDWLPHYEPIQVFNDICRASMETVFHVPQKDGNGRQDSQRQGSIQIVHQRTRRQGPILPRQQWDLQSPQMGDGISKQGTIINLCQSKCSSYERDSQPKNLDPSGAGKDNAHPRQQAMAKGYNKQPLALPSIWQRTC